MLKFPSDAAEGEFREARNECALITSVPPHSATVSGTQEVVPQIFAEYQVLHISDLTFVS